MLFPTYAFLAFFAVVFPIYWALPWRRARLLWLLAASAFFYMSWNPWLITLILFSASVDYFSAQALEKVTRPGLRRLLLIGSITLNLALLAFFKYVNFFLRSANGLASWLGYDLHTPLFDIILPLGISFYTFETISYIVDVYLGRTKAVRNLLDYALFILFFPHLVAGPIVRPRDFLPQLARPKAWRWSRASLGVRMFLFGFVKKAVIADRLAPLAEAVFGKPSAYSSLSVWAGVLAYTVQIYCDFSGYSDMAIGLAHLFGFKLPQNFRRPYLAGDISDFWRRWHISLSSWLRDYLFIPLGGSRGGEWQTCRNLLIVMLLGGLWHGANWTFVAWGLYHGLLLVVCRLTPWPRWANAPRLRPLCVAATLVLVCIGWVFFRAQTFTGAGELLARMGWPTAGMSFKGAEIAAGFLCLGMILAANAIGSRVRWHRLEERWSAPVLGAGLATVLLLATMFMPGGSLTFIYFQF